MNAYLKFWSNIFNLHDLSSRKEFNISFWPHILFIFSVFVIGPMLGLPKIGFDFKKPIGEMLLDLDFQFYHFLVILVLLIPIITLMARRCRDLGMNTIHAFIIGFFPISYSIYLLFFLVLGQGLPPTDLVGIIYYSIIALPFLYLFYMFIRFTFVKGVR
ncbi:DUF805 domain-containing protein [Macrococcus animalis]|uniref:DUF805 domain-containing protein n=1 Tax=Macrococcus animalis TaxID=3395467 RepID=UPI0039BE1B22